MSQQLVKKGANGRMVNVNPKSWIEAIKDKNTGQTLVEILQGFNMYFLPYNGNTSSTRCLVPTMLRKKGLWITYVKYDGNVYTEWYAADELDDKSWGDSSNWRIGNNTLVGDITISANGNWVINGTETEFQAVGEKGNTPLIRVANNRLQVSYDLGDTYRDVTNNPVYTKFRWLATTRDTQANNVGRIQASTDEGKTWTNMSNDFTNNLYIKKYIGVNESLPTSGIAEGTIYAKGPYYAEDDTLNDNPIYRLWVYAWKGNTLAWQDNGEFQSIAAGVVQETGDSETKIMSQKAVTDKLSELGSKVSCITFIGKNNVLVSQTAKFFVAGRKYRVVLKEANWDVSGITTSWNPHRFGIQIIGKSTVVLKYVELVQTLDSNEFVITIPSDYDCNTQEIEVYGRATEGVEFGCTIDLYEDELYKEIEELKIKDNSLSNRIEEVHADAEMTTGLDVSVYGKGETSFSIERFKHIILQANKTYNISLYCDKPTFTGSEEAVSMMQVSSADITNDIIEAVAIFNVGKDKAGSEIKLSKKYTPSISCYLVITSRVLISDKIEVSILEDTDLKKEFEKGITDTKSIVESNKKEALEKIEDVKLGFNKYRIVGEGTVGKTIKTFIPKNKKFKIYSTTPKWEHSNSNPGYGGWLMFELSYYKDGNKTVVANATGDKDSIDEVYNIKSVEADYYQIYARADIGTSVDFCIEKEPEDKGFLVSSDLLMLNGKDFKYNGAGGTDWTIVTEPKYRLLEGQEYHFNLECDNPIYTGTESATGMIGVQLVDYATNALIEPQIFNIDKSYSGSPINRSANITPTTTCYLRIATRLATESVLNISVVGKNKVEENHLLARTDKQRFMAKSLGIYTNDNYPIKNLVFMHISDTHGSTTIHNNVGVPTEIPSRAIPMNNAIQLMNDLIGNASGSRTGNNVQFMIHTGDAKYAEADDDFSYFVNAVTKTTKPVYIVAGNHDVGNSFSVEKGMTDAQIYTQMVEPFLAKWSLKNDTTASDSNYVPCHIEGKNYYYTDYSEEKIRIIFLYEYETDFAANGNTLLYHRGARAFRQEQIDWFVKALLSTPEGYGVMVVKHQPENANGGSDNPFNAYHVRNAKGGQQTYVGLTMIADIVQAFIDGNSINRNYNQTGGVVTTLNVNADFSGKKANTEFIAYISGHTHNDSISVLKDYPRQLELNIGCCNTWYYGGSDVLHKPNDLSEDLINVYSIDRNRGCVYVVRLGTDFTCMAQRRDFAEIKYRL